MDDEGAKADRAATGILLFCLALWVGTFAFLAWGVMCSYDWKWLATGAGCSVVGHLVPIVLQLRKRRGTNGTP